MSESPVKLLDVQSLRAGYRANEILHGVDLRVPPHSIVALLGHNGAGKTTLVRTIFGLHPASGGRVLYGDHELPPRDAGARVDHGVALVPQTGNVFPNLSVRDNLRTAVEMGRSRKQDPDDALEFAFGIFPALADRMEQRAGSLSGGQRQMLGVSITLVRRPSLLILDEPSLGIAPNLVQRLMESLVQIRDSLGTSILLIDQAVRSALRVADHAYVLKSGRVALDAPAAGLRDEDDLWQYF